MNLNGQEDVRRAASVKVSKQAHWNAIIKAIMQLEPHEFAFSQSEYSSLTGSARHFYELGEDEPDVPEYAQLNFLTERGRVKRSIYTEPHTTEHSTQPETLDPAEALMG